MDQYTEQMREVFNIEKFPDYPQTGNPNKDAAQFAHGFQQVTLLRNDPVYYSSDSSGADKPEFLSNQK